MPRQFSFRREGQKPTRHQALHRELEQVDGTYALRESGEAYRGQIDSKNEALRPENTLSWERITELAELGVVRIRAPSDGLLVESGPRPAPTRA